LDRRITSTSTSKINSWWTKRDLQKIFCGERREIWKGKKKGIDPKRVERAFQG
jgi:hypothetical protein